MVPLRLRLRNFMSYREDVPLLDLEGISVACLSGDNGHGKTALLEAMTWALWGAARGRKDLDDDLITLGADEMEVELEFSAAGQRYRVVRKRSRATRRHPSGQSMLDLQIAQAPGFHSIAGSTLRETERRIQDTLRLSYETFVSSAFLLQGRADIFTAENTPAQRKELLAEILDLAIYDHLEARAREHARERRSAVEQLRRSLEEKAAELARKGDYERERQQNEEELRWTESQAQLQQQKIETLQARWQALEGQRAQYRELSERFGAAQRERERAQGEVHEREKRVSEYRELMARQSSIQAGYQRLQGVRAQIMALAEQVRQLVTYQQALREAERAVEQARRELLIQQSRHAALLQELEGRAATLPRLEEEFLLAKDRVLELERWEAGLQELRERAQGAAAEVQEMHTANRRRREEMEALKERLELLQGEAARCPLCQQPLTPEHRHQLVASLQAQGEALRDEYRAMEEAIRSKDRQRTGLQERSQELEAQFQRDQRAALSRVGQLEQAEREARQAVTEVVTLRRDIDALTALLQANDFAPEAQRAFQAARRGLASLTYKEADHRAAEQEVGVLAPFEEEARRLREAELHSAQEEAALQAAQASVGRWERELQQLADRRAALEAALAGEATLAAALQEAQESAQRFAEERSRLERLLGAVLQRLDALEAMERRAQEERAQLQHAEREQGIYEELALAFGKGGAQALLIETAIPELQEEANRLLARMTDGRVAVKLETQRQTRGGRIQETLEIRVSDELGTRSYETYSGGEAFRINFALRIALSQLLAHRAGAPLPTLIIDEGFGTQDASGREKLVEAIHAIQGDFERILVITHLEELKDAFPVRIEVTKTTQGSTFTVA